MLLVNVVVCHRRGQQHDVLETSGWKNTMTRWPPSLAASVPQACSLNLNRENICFIQVLYHSFRIYESILTSSLWSCAFIRFQYCFSSFFSTKTRSCIDLYEINYTWTWPSNPLSITNMRFILGRFILYVKIIC